MVTENKDKLSIQHSFYTQQEVKEKKRMGPCEEKMEDGFLVIAFCHHIIALN
jgi:hypothetical protein